MRVLTIGMLALTASANQAVQAPEMDYSLWLLKRAVTYYEWGGIDHNSYVYWPTKAPDMEPLRLVKAGQRESAFNYCMAKIDSTKGDLRFFYSIQAATLGFRLYKPHLAFEKLARSYDKSLKEAAKVSNFDPEVSTSDIVAMYFALKVTNFLIGDDRNNPNLRAALKFAEARPYVKSKVEDKYKELRLSKFEHRAIAALITFDDGSDDWETAPDKWSKVMKQVPARPDFYLVYRQLLGQLNGTKKYTEYRREAPMRAAEAALALDPEYDRALYAVAMDQKYKDPRRSEKLIRKYLALGTGSKLLIARANALLDYLKKVNKTK